MKVQLLFLVLRSRRFLLRLCVKNSFHRIPFDPWAINWYGAAGTYSSFVSAAAAAVSLLSSSPSTSTSSSSLLLLYCTTYTELSFLFRYREATLSKILSSSSLVICFLGIITSTGTNSQAVVRYGGSSPGEMRHSTSSAIAASGSGTCGSSSTKSERPPHPQQRQRSMAHQCIPAAAGVAPCR
jgi:hypothetical protein